MATDPRTHTTQALSRWQQLHLRHVAHRRVLDRLPGKRALVLIPHPDDEVLGLGGTLVKFARDVQFRLVYLTDGRIGAGDKNAEQAMAATRLAEARAVCARLGCEPVLVGCNEHQFARPEQEATLVARIANELKSQAPEVVFVPFLWDAHGDHRYANHLLAKALLATGQRPVICGYEVWSMAPPGWVVDVTAHIDEKLALLDCYRSQLALFDYRTMLHVRGALHAPLVPGARACEVFWPARADAWLEIVADADLASPAAQQTIVLMTPPETLPPGP